MARQSTFRVMQQKLGRENLLLGPSLFVGGEAARQALALEINPGRGFDRNQWKMTEHSRSGACCTAVYCRSFELHFKQLIALLYSTALPIL